MVLGNRSTSTLLSAASSSSSIPSFRSSGHLVANARRRTPEDLHHRVGVTRQQSPTRQSPAASRGAGVTVTPPDDRSSLSPAAAAGSTVRTSRVRSPPAIPMIVRPPPARASQPVSAVVTPAQRPSAPTPQAPVRRTTGQPPGPAQPHIDPLTLEQQLRFHIKRIDRVDEFPIPPPTLLIPVTTTVFKKKYLAHRGLLNQNSLCCLISILNACGRMMLMKWFLPRTRIVTSSGHPDFPLLILSSILKLVNLLICFWA